MRPNRLLFLPLLVGALAAGCGDDGPTGPKISDFAGTWNATSITYTSIGTPTRTLNVYAAAGARLGLVITATGSFTGNFLVPPNPNIPITAGQLTLQGTNMANIDFTWPAGIPEPISDFVATYTMSGNNLTFTRPTTTFQFPGQPAAEASSLVIAMVRT